MKLWNLNVVCKINKENLKERALKRLPYWGLVVLKSPMGTYDLFTTKMRRGNFKGDSETFY